MKTYAYEAIIQKVPDIDGAFVEFPYDLKAEFGKGRIKVHATFDGVPYDGSIVNMGVKNADGSICYIIGIRKDIRAAINKQAGDTIKVTITEKSDTMWKCPKCDREFKKVEQGHYCVKTSSIDEYIAIQPENIRPLLQNIRETIRTAAPETTEKMSWQMPTFWQGENLIQFAAFKKHIGVYPGGEATAVFSERLKDYKVGKGSIQFPLDKPIDYELIADIVHWRLEQLN